METPYNENLLLSSSTGANGFADPVFGAQAVDPLQPGKRDEVEVGIQQGFGGWVVADFGYFNKHTKNAYDFDVLFDTPIVFPISWDHSRSERRQRARGSRPARRLQRVHGVWPHECHLLQSRERAAFCLTRRCLPATSGSTTIRSFSRRRTFSTSSTRPRALGSRLNWRYESGLVAGGPCLTTRLPGACRRPAGGDRACSAAERCGDTDVTHHRVARHLTAARRAVTSRPTAPKTT